MKITTHTRLMKRAIRKGFTLVELLVVMAIIAVLASISYGPIMGFLGEGKKTEVRAMCNEFEMAIDGFKAEYSYLPYGSDHPDDDANVITDDSGKAFIQTLLGKNLDVNDKGIEYLGIKTAENGRNGYLDTEGTIKDHWGNPFTIRLDYDLDGKLNANSLNAAFDDKPLNADSLIATPGKKKNWAETSITSW